MFVLMTVIGPKTYEETRHRIKSVAKKAARDFVQEHPDSVVTVSTRGRSSKVFFAYGAGRVWIDE